MKCFQITISGELRGHGFRFSVVYMAISLNVKGFVEYPHAGVVLIEAEGDEKHLEQFITGLRNLVGSWKISDFSIVETAPKGYSTFELRNSIYREEARTRKPFAIKYLNSFSAKIHRMFGSDKHDNLQSN